MNVKELIEELQKVKNKEKEVYFYDRDGEINLITYIDDSISDRLDIN